jgi:hypothetical protein
VIRFLKFAAIAAVLLVILAVVGTFGASEYYTSQLGSGCANCHEMAAYVGAVHVILQHSPPSSGTFGSISPTAGQKRSGCAMSTSFG